MIVPACSAPNADIAVLVARLEDFLAGHLADSEKHGLTVSAAQLGAAIDEALRRCRGLSPSAPPPDSGVEVFLLDGISATLVEEREGVFEKQKDADGEEHYRAVSVEVWIECLTALRARVDSYRPEPDAGRKNTVN
ncbi:MAG: hypothetical protein LBK71_10530 [Verrucomicrobiales bacterium]|jgi:hypothetical protein|nr:hypothetical protein [Verrucomicrobiales bacterium]MDR1305036.1 hypothetical protein [Verrucomicrobiales bacterium]